MPFNINQQNGKNIFNIENLNVNAGDSHPSEKHEGYTIDQIKEQLANGETIEAIQALKTYLISAPSKQSMIDELIMLSSRYAEVNHQEIHALNSHENISIEKAKVVRGILDLVGRIDVS
ncbi:hypothetical protein [Haliscomenobacter sp.]|uniref:hypothetical protein n=1 Tax=Haliscomenobacter sp. TaxID=2717303 RepID=UPI003BAC0D3C